MSTKSKCVCDGNLQLTRSSRGCSNVIQRGIGWTTREEDPLIWAATTGELLTPIQLVFLTALNHHHQLGLNKIKTSRGDYVALLTTQRNGEP